MSARAEEPFMQSERAYRLFFVLLLLVVTITGAITCLIGAVSQRAYGQDTFILLDGAWRVMQGQRPQIDFHTTLGPFTFMVLGFGLWLAKGFVAGLGYANGILFVIVSVWAWGLSRVRMTPWLSFLSALCAGCVGAGVSCYAYGYLHIPYTGYAAIYNRYGEVFTVLIFIETFWSLRPRAGKRQPFLGGFSTGVALVVLFFAKVNFLGVAGGGIVLGALLMPYDRTRWWGMLAGLAVAGVLMLAYLRFDLHAIGYDMVMSVHARMERTRSETSRMLHALPFTLTQIYVLLLIWWLSPSQPRTYHRWLHPMLEQGVILAFFVATQFALLWSNGQLFASSLLAWGALLVLNNRRLETPESTNVPPRRSWAAPRFLAAIPIGLVLFTNFASLGYATLVRVVSKSKIPANERFASETMGGLIGFPKEEVADVNEGLELIRKNSTDQDRVFAFSYNNPFSYALKRKSPRGDSVWWDDNASYSRKFHPDPVTVFAQGDIVIMPKLHPPGSVPARMLLVYGDELSRSYTQVAESEKWVLFRRNAAGTNSPPATGSETQSPAPKSP